MNPYTAEDFERENADILKKLSPLTRALVATGQASFTRNGRTVRVGSYTRAAPPALTRAAEDKARDLLARIEARSKVPNPAPKQDDDAAAFAAFLRSPAAPAPLGGDVAPPPVAPPPQDDDEAAFAAFMRQVRK